MLIPATLLRGVTLEGLRGLSEMEGAATECRGRDGLCVIVWRATGRIEEQTGPDDTTTPVSRGGAATRDAHEQAQTTREEAGTRTLVLRGRRTRGSGDFHADTRPFWRGQTRHEDTTSRKIVRRLPALHFSRRANLHPVTLT